MKGVCNQRKGVYALAEEGERHVRVIEKAVEEIRNLLGSISLLDAASEPPD